MITRENPLENLHVLHATGTLKLNDETKQVERVGGIRYVVKDGIIYDNRQILRRVREIVADEKKRRGIPPGLMPIETVPREY